MIPELRTLKVYKMLRPGETRPSVIGKLCQLDRSTRILYRDYKKAQMHNLGEALSCDVNLTPAARRDGATYVDQIVGSSLYRLTIDEFEAMGTPLDHGQGLQNYVDPRHFEHITPIPYRTQFWQDAPSELIVPPSKPWKPTAPAKAREPKTKRTKPEPPKLQEGLGL